jgi:cell division inhibitor SulA
MKQVMGCYAGYAGLNAARYISIYLQAIWRLSTRHFVRSVGLAGNSKNRVQARDQQLNCSPMEAGEPVSPTVPVCAIKTETPLPGGALTEIRSFSGFSESCCAGEKVQSRQRLTEYETNLSANRWQQELKQMLPALAGFCQQRWLVLLAPPCVPSEEELAAAGIDPARVLLVHSTNANGFTVLQQALRSGTCGAVLAWLENSDEKNLEQLRQAAETGNAWGVLFRANKRNKGAQLEMAIA